MPLNNQKVIEIPGNLGRKKRVDSICLKNKYITRKLALHFLVVCVFASALYKGQIWMKLCTSA